MINVSQFNPTVLSLKDTIYQRIVEMISLGELAPGTTFSEQQLIRLFAVSKSPVREALIQLCSENVLRSKAAAQRNARIFFLIFVSLLISLSGSLFRQS